MPDDYLTATTKRIVAIAAQSSVLLNAVRAGNFINKLAGVKWPDPSNKNSRNFTEFDITVPQQRILNRNAAKTFTNAQGPAGDVIIWKECTFYITLAYRGVDRTAPNAIGAAFEALLLADPRLGLTAPKIKSSGEGFTITIKEETSPRTGNALGLVQEIRFPVVFELRRRDLTTPT